MSGEPRDSLRERLNHVLLALQILARREHPRSQQRRIAQIGLASARTLAALMLHDVARSSQAPGAPQT